MKTFFSILLVVVSLVRPLGAQTYTDPNPGEHTLVTLKRLWSGSLAAPFVDPNPGEGEEKTLKRILFGVINAPVGGDGSFNTAAPGPIGGSTPNTGAFTSLTANGGLTVGTTTYLSSGAFINNGATALSLTGLYFNGHFKLEATGTAGQAVFYKDNETDFADVFVGKLTASGAITGNGSGLTGLTKSQVGLGNVDNTSDVGKPISKALHPSLLGLGDSLIGDAVGGQVGIMYMLSCAYPFSAGNTYYNASMPGHGIADILNAYPSNGHPFTPAVTGDTLCYVYCLAGINDCSTADSAATIYARLLTLWAAIKADGCTLIASTIPANDAATTYNPTKIRALNTLILSDSSKYDLVIDAAAILGTSYPTIADGYFVHPLTSGHQAIAAAIAARLSYSLSSRALYGAAIATGGTLNVGSNTLSDNNGVLTISGRLNWDGGRIFSDGGGAFTTNGLTTGGITTGTLHVNGDQSTGGNIYGVGISASGGLYGSLNGNTITAGTGTLTMGAGKTINLPNSVTVSGTDGSTLNIGAGGTLGTGAFAPAAASTGGQLIYSATPANGIGSITVTLPTGNTFHHLRILSSLRTQFTSETAIVAAWNGDTTTSNYVYQQAYFQGSGVGASTSNPQLGSSIPGLVLGQANGGDAGYPSEFETVIGLASQTAVTRGVVFISGAPLMFETVTRYGGSGPLTNVVISTYNGFVGVGSVSVYGY